MYNIPTRNPNGCDIMVRLLMYNIFTRNPNGSDIVVRRAVRCILYLLGILMDAT